MTVTNKSYKDEALDLIRNQLNDEGEDYEYLRNVLNDKCIGSLFSIFSIVSQFDRTEVQESVTHNCFQLSMEIISDLLNEWINEAQTLCQILSQPHFKALLFASDIIARENYSPLPVDSDISYYSSSNDQQSSSEIDLDSIKIVQVIKNAEPLGATVCIDRNGSIRIARVIYGGAAHRSGLIQVGDQIHEVNGITLSNLSSKECIRILERECRNYCISFKLLPGDTYSGHHKPEDIKESRIRIRTHFDYEANEDAFHPCPEAGLSFKRGDVLHIVNQDDPSWWQARKEQDLLQLNSCVYPPGCRAGIVPSQQLQERRFAYLRDIHTQIDESLGNFPKIFAGCKIQLNKYLFKPRKVKKIMYRAEENNEYSREVIATYDEVAKLYPLEGRYRPIIFIGPSGVGRNELIRHLLLFDENLYQRPIPHTTRAPKDWELDGREYYFVNHEWAEKEAFAGHFVECGKFQGKIYGTHADTIKSIIESGCVCLLNPPPQSLKLLYTVEFKPFVIFVKPPFNLNELKTTRNSRIGNKICNRNFSENDFKEMIISAHRIEYLYGQYFDFTLINGQFEKALEELYTLIRLIQDEPLWAPAHWSSDD